MVSQIFQYRKALYSTRPALEVMASIQNAVQHYDEYKIKSVCVLDNELSFDACSKYLLLVNSFLPHITIVAQEADLQTTILMEFRLQAMAMVPYWIIGVLLLLFEIALLCMDGMNLNLQRLTLFV